jgi:hypothetical protein
MDKKLLRTIVVVSFSGLLILFVSMFVIKVNLSENLGIHYSKKNYPLTGRLRVGQAFTVSRGGLTGLEIRFKKINDVEHQLAIDLYQGEVGDVLIKKAFLRGEFSSKDLKNDRFYRFNFPNKLDLKGEKLTFYLVGKTSSESASVSPIISDFDSYAGGEAYINEKAIEGDLLFKPVYRVSLFRFLGYYINKIAFTKPIIFDKMTLFLLIVCLTISYLLVVFLIFYQLCRGENKNFVKSLIICILLIIISFLVLYYQPKISFKLTNV